MGDNADLGRTDTAGEHIFFHQLAGKGGGVHSSTADVEDDDVGLDFAIQLDATEFLQAISEKLGVGMIFVEAFRTFFERNESGCSENARLAHTPAQCLAVDARLLNES